MIHPIAPHIPILEAQSSSAAAAQDHNLSFIPKDVFGCIYHFLDFSSRHNVRLTNRNISFLTPCLCTEVKIVSAFLYHKNSLKQQSPTLLHLHRFDKEIWQRLSQDKEQLQNPPLFDIVQRVQSDQLLLTPFAVNLITKIMQHASFDVTLFAQLKDEYRRLFPDYSFLQKVHALGKKLYLKENIADYELFTKNDADLLRSFFRE